MRCNAHHNWKEILHCVLMSVGTLILFLVSTDTISHMRLNIRGHNIRIQTGKSKRSVEIWGEIPFPWLSAGEENTFSGSTFERGNGENTFTLVYWFWNKNPLPANSRHRYQVHHIVNETQINFGSYSVYVGHFLRRPWLIRCQRSECLLDLLLLPNNGTSHLLEA